MQAAPASSLPTDAEVGLYLPPTGIGTQSQIYKTIRKHAELLLRARILVIDPSIGSYSSQPGYAVYEAGKLVDCGVIEVRPSGAHNLRLFEISRTLREEFLDVKPDVLIIEDVPAARWSGRFSSAKKQVPLHRAVGAILAAVPAPLVLEVIPSVWHRFTDPSRYIKSDVADALAMGYAVLQMAEYAVAHPAKKKTKARR